MDRRQILIVEDSPTMRQLLVFALRRLKDVEISEAQDGMDGLRKVSNDHFDLALIDINMPERKDEELPHRRTVFNNQDLSPVHLQPLPPRSGGLANHFVKRSMKP